MGTGKIVPLIFYGTIALYCVILLSYMATVVWASDDLPPPAIMSSKTVVELLIIGILLILSLLFAVLSVLSLVICGIHWKLIVALIMNVLPSLLFFSFKIQSRVNVANSL